jgi:hydrogenase maturation protease
MQTQCLVEGDAQTQCEVKVRFLRMVDRTIGKLRNANSGTSSITEADLEKVDRLEVNGETYQPWQEAVEEDIEVAEFNLSALASQPMQWPFRFSAKQEIEPLLDERSAIAGILQRDKSSIAGMVELTAERVAPGLYKLTSRLSNTSRFEPQAPITREAALSRALVSAHTVLEVRSGHFVSLIDPPEECREFAAACQNIGTWPILVGEAGQRDTMLSSPIILYDYPQIAPESPGDLFDGAEIDEILSLRILTMTDEEKQEMRGSDDRTRKILERTESMPDEQFKKLHGALRGLRPLKEELP